MKIFFLILIITAHVKAQSLNDYTQVLIQLQERIDFFADLNNKITLDRHLCLEKYDLTLMKGQEIESQDPFCFKILSDLISTSHKSFHEMRVTKSLLSVPIARFLSLGAAELSTIPTGVILNPEIQYDIQFKDYDAAKIKPIIPETLSSLEKNDALREFYNFRDHTCHLAESHLNKYGRLQLGGSKPLAFCEMLFKNQIYDIQTHPSGRYALQEFSKLLKSRYEHSFRPYLKDRYARLLSERPYLALIRGPENFKADLRTAFYYVQAASNQFKAAQEKFKADENLQQRITDFQSGRMSVKEVELLNKTLKRNFKFEMLSEAFKNNTDIKNPEAYSKLLQSDRNEKAFISMMKGTGILAATLACFIPVTAAGARVATPVVAKIFGKSLTALTGLQLSLICGAVLLTPVNIMSTVESVNKLSELNDLFFSQVDGSTIFADYKHLSELEKTVFISYFTTPIDLALAASGLAALKAIRPQNANRILDYLRSAQK